MYIIERLWAVMTSVVSIASLSSIPDRVDEQTPLELSLPNRPVEQEVSLPKVGRFPKFSPPGVLPGDNFTCEYPSMPDWVDCSHELDRKCWLKHKTNGSRFDIYTDYEKFRPVGKDRYYDLELSDGEWTADGLNFSMAKLFNGQYPGPWIQACWGDRLIVTVTNNLKENGTSVHWHGIRQLKTTHMDGVNGITQCPIAPGDYFVYNFTLQQYGSSWYHSHYSVQYADGAVGPMTIHGPSSADWDEAAESPLLMTDWYHNTAFEVLQNPSNTKGESILVNGRGNITKFTGGRKPPTTEIESPLEIIFERSVKGRGCRKYLLRVINTSFASTFVFSIDNHLLTIASADFVPISPYRNTSVLVGIGQRYNIIVEASPLEKNPLTNESLPLDPHDNYWIRTQYADCFRREPPKGAPDYDKLAILRYDNTSTLEPTSQKWSDILLKCMDEAYTSLHPILPWKVDPPSNGIFEDPHYGEEFQIHGESQKKYPQAFFVLDNKYNRRPMQINYSDPIFLHLDPRNQSDHWDNLWRVEEEPFNDNKWIYLVLNGFNFTRSFGAHPMHLHGHDFAILEQVSSKKFVPSEMKLKLDNPPRRDVVLLPSNGYVVIAFKADNPGPWLVHCHIAFHISEGLGMQILEDPVGSFKLWPYDDDAVIEAQRVCKNWDVWYSNKTNWAYKPTSIGGPCNYTNEKWCFQDDSGV